MIGNFKLNPERIIEKPVWHASPSGDHFYTALPFGVLRVMVTDTGYSYVPPWSHGKGWIKVLTSKKTWEEACHEALWFCCYHVMEGAARYIPSQRTLEQVGEKS
jgi:hypothetical protein